MKKLLFFNFIILFGKFSFSQSEIDNIIQNKTEEGFVEYFKKNGTSGIEGLYLIGKSPVKSWYLGPSTPYMSAIIRYKNKFYEYLIEDKKKDFSNFLGKVINTYTFDSIARKSKFFAKPQIYRRFLYKEGPYSRYSNTQQKKKSGWIVSDTRSGGTCYKDCDETEVLKFVTRVDAKNTKVSYEPRVPKNKWRIDLERVKIYPSKNYLTKKDLDIPYYDFDLDEYYYEYANEMRAMVQYNSVKRTDITSDGYYNYFIITADGEFFTAQKVLWLNKENKVVCIEEFHKDSYGEIDQVWDKTISQYINKYDVDKKWSDQELIIPTKHRKRYFDKIFGFKNLTYKDTPSTVYVGYTTQKHSEWPYGSTKYGYRLYRPVRKTYSESEIKLNKQFGSGVSIGKGFMESFKGNKYGLMRALGKETYENKLKSFDNNVGYSMLFLVQDKESPTEYVNSFNNLIGFMYPSLLKSKTSETKVTFTSLDEGVIAIAAGMNKNCESHLLVDIEKWNNSTFEERLFIVFHELGHDLFNLTHSDGVRLMATNKFNVVSNEELGDMIQEMFFYVLNYKDKSTYDCN